MSTLSTPMPARPMTLRLVAASMISLVTLVAERIARPSYWPITALSSSGVIPGFTSTSQPRSSKMRAALGSILSEMRTLGFVMKASLENGMRKAAGAWPAVRGSDRLERSPGPVEPGAERLDVGRIDRRAAPDAQARRGVAIAGDVVSRAFLLQQAGESLDEVGVGAFDREAHRSARADALVLGKVAEPVACRDDLVQRRGIGVGAGLETFQAAETLGPFESPDRVFDRQHRGRVDRLPLEDAFGELALGHQAEDLRQRPGRGMAFEPLHRPRAEDEHAVPAFAAEHLLPREGRDIDLVPGNVVGEHRAGRVGETEAFAVVRNPVAVRHAHAGGGTIPGEQHVVRPVDLAQIRNLAIVGAQDR